jgi:kynureninase
MHEKVSDVVTDRAYAEALDVEYPLDAHRAKLLRSDVIYLDGNSLGPLPLATRDRLARFTDEEWGGDLVRGWQRWIDLPAEVGDRLGAALVGSGSGQVVVTDSVTVNLYKLAWAALDAAPPGRRIIVTRDDDFPTDAYVLAAVAEQFGGAVRAVHADPVEGLDVTMLADALDDEVALVALSLVAYRSGALADLPAITQAVHEAGALVLWDLSHAVGAVPIDLDAVGVDLAVGCTYKYVCAGPGAPAFLHVRRDLAEGLRTPIPGWFGHSDQFAMTSTYAPAAGVRRFLGGTPPVAGLLAVDEGVALLAEVGVDVLRATSIALTTYLVELADAWLPEFTLASPRQAARRGGHVALAHPDAYAISAALIGHAGVIPDVRPPDLLRLAPAPLVTSFVDVREGVRRIRELVASGYAAATRGRVT